MDVIVRVAGSLYWWQPFILSATIPSSDGYTQDADGPAPESTFQSSPAARTEDRIHYTLPLYKKRHSELLKLNIAN